MNIVPCTCAGPKSIRSQSFLLAARGLGLVRGWFTPFVQHNNQPRLTRSIAPSLGLVLCKQPRHQLVGESRAAGMRRISTGSSLNRIGVLWSVDLPTPPNSRQLRLRTTQSSVVTPRHTQLVRTQRAHTHKARVWSKAAPATHHAPRRVHNCSCTSSSVAPSPPP